jgi:uncharacterized protein (DUF2249 family)
MAVLRNEFRGDGWAGTPVNSQFPLIVIKVIDRDTIILNAMPNLTPLELDVRPLCAQKKAPMPAILTAVSRLAPAQALRLIAPFEPVPLYEFLEARGFSHQSREREPGVWEVLFTPTGQAE